MEPGQTINPQDTSEQKTELPKPETLPTPTSPVLDAPATAAESQVDAQTQTQPPEQKPLEWNVQAAIEQPMGHDVSDGRAVSWSASEFIDHDKRATWFLGLAAVDLLLGGLVYLVTREISTVLVVLVAVALFGVTAARKPSTLTYTVDSKGVTIGTRPYEYQRFKSFSIMEEGAMDSIQLNPLTRFAPPINLYYPPDQEDQIVNLLSNYLPYEERNHDAVDRLMKRIRF